MRMHNFRLPLYSRPAQKAATPVAVRLTKEKRPRKKTITPPNIADNAPKNGPRITPVTGAIIAAAVIAAPDRPIIGKTGKE